MAFHTSVRKTGANNSTLIAFQRNTGTLTADKVAANGIRCSGIDGSILTSLLIVRSPSQIPRFCRPSCSLSTLLQLRQMLPSMNPRALPSIAPSSSLTSFALLPFVTNLGSLPSLASRPSIFLQNFVSRHIPAATEVETGARSSRRMDWGLVKYTKSKK
jgi:hypothetical protein